MFFPYADKAAGAQRKSIGTGVGNCKPYAVLPPFQARPRAEEIAPEQGQCMVNRARTLQSSITGDGFHTVPEALRDLWDMAVGSSAACWSLGRKLEGRRGDPRRRQGQARL